MSQDNTSLWTTVLMWLYGNRTEWGYAAVACMFSLLRGAYTTNPWGRRILDAVSCSALAFFSSPVLEVTGALFNWHVPDAAAQVAAVFIGYVGNDYISVKLRGWINRKTGGYSNANQ